MLHALRRDLDKVAEVWVDAFAADPFLRWIQPDDSLWPRFAAAWTRWVAGLAFERGHLYLEQSGVVAIAWIPPDLALAAPHDLDRAREIIAEHSGETRADSAIATIEAVRGHALTEAHWTLQFFGVRSSSQNRGIGAAVVAPMLTVCDEEQLPCTLVSSNRRNVPFYERLGFRVVAEVPTPDGVAVELPMRRTARDRPC